MFLASRGVPDVWLVVATVVGGTLSAGSANALNCVYDRDIDQRMRRTRRRALPRHMVSPRAALVFGLALGRASRRCCSGFWVNWLSAGLALAANVVLRRRLHDAAEAAHQPEHRLGRRRRLLPGADRLDRGHRLAGLGAGGAVPRRLLLDAAALLGAGAALPRGLRRRRRADAAVGGAGRRRSAGRSSSTPGSRSPRRWCCGRWRRRGGCTRSPRWSSARCSSPRRTCCQRRTRQTDNVVEMRPMRLFHWSNMYLSLLFLSVALDPLLTR